ncbi:MAG: putative transcriptional regulator, TetR family [Glaciihabitans sp.]|nr:putative transcriptional regulator, TetR family [Glaciihabitans sp.]
MSGRRAQVALNDEAILRAARSVFVADPSAPISAVAERAGVSMGALYRRYPSKDALLRKICGDGMSTYIACVDAALADDSDQWPVFATFMQRVVEADTHSMTVALAGTFGPTNELFAEARRCNELNKALVERFRAVLRPGITAADLACIFEQLAAIRVGGELRIVELRRRYLVLFLDSLRASNTTELPGSPPTFIELESRWVSI